MEEIKLSSAQKISSVSSESEFDDVLLCNLHIPGLKIFQGKKTFRYGLDAVLLADYALPCVQKNSHVIDLGTGNGIIPILLRAGCGKTSDKEFVGLEVQRGAVRLAEKSVELNGFSSSIKIVEGNLKDVRSFFEENSFDVVVSNPPYIKAGSGRENPVAAKNIARHEILCTLRDVVYAASVLLRDGGSFFMIHRPERLKEIFAYFEEFSFLPVKVRNVVPFENKAPTMVLLCAEKSAVDKTDSAGRNSVKHEKPLIVYKEKNVYSDEINRIYGVK